MRTDAPIRLNSILNNSLNPKRSTPNPSTSFPEIKLPMPSVMFGAVGKRPDDEDDDQRTPLELPSLGSLFGNDSPLIRQLGSFSPIKPAPGKGQVGDDEDLEDLIRHMRLEGFTRRPENLLPKPFNDKEQQDVLKLLDGLYSLAQGNEKVMERLDQLAIASVKWDDKPALLTALNEMADNKVLDLPGLEKSFLKTYFNKIGIPVETITDSQIGKWDLNQLEALAKGLNNLRSFGGEYDYRQGLIELCQKTLAGEYKSYLHDPNVESGQVNLATKRAFAETFKDKGIVLNYDAWLNFPGKVRYKKLTQKETHLSILSRFSDLIKKNGTPDAEANRVLNPAGFQFKDGAISAIKNAEVTMDVLQRAAFLSESRQKPTQPRSMKDDFMSGPGVTIDRLFTTFRRSNEQRDDSMEIRLWQRQPGHDLFQGNYTGACIAMGHGNEKASLEVLQHTFVQLAEVYNEAKQQVTGKALFFWAKDLKTGDPVFILNTFEGRDDGGEEDPHTRDQLLKFAEEFSQSVAGRKVKICTAKSPWNPLYTADSKVENLDLQVVGNTASGQYYFDTFSMNRIDLDRPQLHTPIYVMSSPAPTATSSFWPWK